MLEIGFEGWFQCRIASDPDPTDEPRGISGCSFALVTEPDLDRVINFQPPSKKLVREFGPQIGVSVHSVSIDGREVVASSLLNAEVRLHGARFEEHNGAVVPRNTAFIDPFDLEISSEGSVLRRRALWDPKKPDLSFYQVDASDFAPRQPKLDLDSKATVVLESGVAATVSGDRAGKPLAPSEVAIEYWKIRLQRLLEKKKKAKNEDKRAALQQRIDALELPVNDWRHQRLEMLLCARINFSFDLNSPEPTVEGDFGKRLDEGEPWGLELWMGAWDNDALCGFAKGTLLVPILD